MRLLVRYLPLRWAYRTVTGIPEDSELQYRVNTLRQVVECSAAEIGAAVDIIGVRRVRLGTHSHNASVAVIYGGVHLAGAHTRPARSGHHHAYIVRQAPGISGGPCRKSASSAMITVKDRRRSVNA